MKDQEIQAKKPEGLSPEGQTFYAENKAILDSILDLFKQFVRDHDKASFSLFLSWFCSCAQEAKRQIEFMDSSENEGMKEQ